MRRIGKLLLVATAALCCDTSAFAWPWDGLGKWAEDTFGPFYHTDKVCNFSDKYFHDIIYVYYKVFGLEGPYTFYKDERSRPSKLCVCIAMGGSGGSAITTRAQAGIAIATVQERMARRAPTTTPRPRFRKQRRRRVVPRPSKAA